MASKKFIILDDAAGIDLSKNDKLFDKLFNNYRHYNLDLIIEKQEIDEEFSPNGESVMSATRCLQCNKKVRIPENYAPPLVFFCKSCRFKK